MSRRTLIVLYKSTICFILLIIRELNQIVKAKAKVKQIELKLVGL